MDAAFWQHHVDLPVDRLAQALDGEVDRMLPFAVAAIRETWEEAGLLLTTPMKTIASPERVGSSCIPFSRGIQAHGLRLAVSKLGRWHHWITPELMPRRFDTFLDTLLTESRSRSWPTPIMPRLWPLGKSALIVLPWDPDYARQTVSVDIDRLEKDRLPVGAPFSRLWRHRGICRPVRHPDENGGQHYHGVPLSSGRVVSSMAQSTAR